MGTYDYIYETYIKGDAVDQIQEFYSSNFGPTFATIERFCSDKPCVFIGKQIFLRYMNRPFILKKIKLVVYLHSLLGFCNDLIEELASSTVTPDKKLRGWYKDYIYHISVNDIEVCTIIKASDLHNMVYETMQTSPGDNPVTLKIPHRWSMMYRIVKKICWYSIDKNPQSLREYCEYLTQWMKNKGLHPGNLTSRLQGFSRHKADGDTKTTTTTGGKMKKAASSSSESTYDKKNVSLDKLLIPEQHAAFHNMYMRIISARHLSEDIKYFSAHLTRFGVEHTHVVSVINVAEEPRLKCVTFFFAKKHSGGVIFKLYNFGMYTLIPVENENVTRVDIRGQMLASVADILLLLQQAVSDNGSRRDAIKDRLFGSLRAFQDLYSQLDGLGYVNKYIGCIEPIREFYKKSGMKANVSKQCGKNLDPKQVKILEDYKFMYRPTSSSD